MMGVMSNVLSNGNHTNNNNTTYFPLLLLFAFNLIPYFCLIGTIRTDSSSNSSNANCHRSSICMKNICRSFLNKLLFYYYSHCFFFFFFFFDSDNRCLGQVVSEELLNNKEAEGRSQLK